MIVLGEKARKQIHSEAIFLKQETGNGESLQLGICNLKLCSYFSFQALKAESGDSAK